MNTESMIVLAAVALLVAGAVYGCYRTMRNGKSCCGEHSETQHCCIRREEPAVKQEAAEAPKKEIKNFEPLQIKKEEPLEKPQ